MSGESLTDALPMLRQRSGVEAVDLAVVLGSGWSLAAHGIGDELLRVPYRDVPGLRAPSVAGHEGTLRLIDVKGLRILAFGGRTHLYEARGVEAVVSHVRLGASFGAHTILLTNGCGSIRTDWAPGTPVLISDHLNLTATSPLSGATFMDCTNVYDVALRNMVRELDPSVPEGVYAQFRGPQYETPAEVRMARIFGADLVGMSTALEAIEARRLAMRVLGLSLVTNHAAGVSAEPLNHHEVLDTGRSAAPRLNVLLAAVFESLARETAST